MKLMHNGCDITVFDYSCLAVIDLINLFILLVIYQRIDDLFAHLSQRVAYICLAGNFKPPLNWNGECFPKLLSNRFPVTFKSPPVDVLVLGFVQGRVSVKEVGNESQVQLGVPSDYICGCDKLPAAQPLCLLQHAFCPLDVILLLQKGKGQFKVGSRLSMQKGGRRTWTRNGNLMGALGV